MTSKKHWEFCEGHLTCPKTKKEECGKVTIVTHWTNGECTPAQVLCHGCGEQHRVELEEGES